MTWKRARSGEQKEVRIKEILTATAGLFAKKNFEDITLIHIAKEAKFTRSNLYKYFTTKEEVFLALFMNDIKEWSEAILQVFDVKKKYSIEKFSQLWRNALKDRQQMLKLYPLCAVLLEKNVSIEMLIEYKKLVMEMAVKITGLLEKILPDLPKDKIFYFIIIQISLAAGLHPMAHALTEKQKMAIEEAGLIFPEIEFEEYFGMAIETVLKGLK